jgi:hypothetical protein
VTVGITGQHEQEAVMSKGGFVAVVFILTFAAGVQGVHAEQAPQRWDRLSRIRPGERVTVTTAQGEQAAVFVAADSSSVLVADLSGVPEESARKAISRAVREASTPSVPGERDVNRVKFRVIRLEKEQVQRMTRLSARSSKTATIIATSAAAVGGLFLGVIAGVAVDGGILGPDRGGSEVALAVAIAFPATVGFAVHSATKRSYTEVLYLAPPPVSLNEADWQAVQEALPHSLRQARKP